MPLPRLTRIALALAFFAPLSTVHAQPHTEPLPGPPVSLDLALGGGAMQHDPYADANGIQAEALLAARFLTRPGGSLVLAAIGFATVVGFGSDLECLIDPSVSGCVARAMLEPIAALLGGAELRRYGAALRVLAGPIRYRTGDAGPCTGSHVRLDLAVPASSRMAVVLATRMSYVGRFRGEALEIFSMSVGLRFQR